MHELALAENVVRAVAEELHRSGRAPVGRVVVRAGPFAGVDPEALRFCLRLAVEEAGLLPLGVEVLGGAATLDCPACGEVPAEDGFALACPRCGGRVTVADGGRELEVWLDDEDRPDEAGPRGE